MEGLFLKLLNMSIAAGWLILAVVLLRILLKRAPKYIRCILWALVGIRLTVPFSFESVLSLIPSAETVSPDMLYSDAPRIHSGIGVLNQAVNPVISESLAPQIGVSVNPLQILTFLAALIWAAGVVLMSLYGIISYLRLRRRIAEAVPLRDNLWQCETVGSPFVLGLFQPRIYLPFHMDEAGMAHVIAHEQAHIKRGDHLIKMAAFFLLTVYWFQPLVWLAYFLLCRDIELACDERVIKELGLEEKKAYSEALLSCSAPRRSLAACPLAFGEVGVKQRIRNVMSYRKPALWVVAAALAVCVAAGVCFLTDPAAGLEMPGVFGRTYQVAEVVYDAPQYSFAYTTETAPQYSLTSDGQLLKCELAEGSWEQVGKFHKTALTQGAFEGYFSEVDGTVGWVGKNSAAKLRQNNQTAWRLDVEHDLNHVFYLLLQQKNGDVYLTYGYDDSKESGGTDLGGALIRWVCRLEPAGVPRLPMDDNQRLDGVTYAFDSVVYMNPASSFFAGEGTGCLYRVGSDSFTILNEENGEVLQTFSGISWDWQPLLHSEWKGMFMMDEQAPEIGAVKNPLKLQLSAEDYLFNMDGALWLARYNGGKVGMWSVYSLKPADAGSNLERSVSSAILEHNQNSLAEGDIGCESHATLATLPGERWDGKAGKTTETLEVYIMALYLEFRSDGKTFQEVGGSHVPTVLTFDVEENDIYILRNYWVPRDGSYYKPDIEERFGQLSAEVISDALNTQKYIVPLTQECYRQAVEYLGIDTDRIIEELFERIMSSPAVSSNPSDYIDAHTEEYRELIYFGEDTLRYIDSELDKGGPDGLEENLMRIVREELHP